MFVNRRIFKRCGSIVMILAITLLVVSYFRQKTQDVLMRFSSNSLSFSKKPQNEAKETQKDVASDFNVHPFNWSQPYLDKGTVEKCLNITADRFIYQICIHNTKSDKYVSATLAEGRPWDSVVLSYVDRFLMEYTNATFIDIGANIGAHSLHVAAMNRTVLAVEASPEHLSNLHKAVLLNHFQDRITLLPYAISDQREQKLKMSKSLVNAGHTFVVKAGMTPSSFIYNVTSIQIEDLTPFVHSKVAIVKMDIENSECTALKHPIEFFKKIKVPYLLMEWLFDEWSKIDTDCVHRMVTNLISVGFLPCNLDGKPLRLENWKPNSTSKWPPNILWVNVKMNPGRVII